ncbi:hypothetical protein [Nocardia sp. NPDC005825]|uniref:hypothetical protein n=1 Tax=unclassified Nocardia TaxID=2637762 RepID=UPI0033D956C7
MAATFAATGEAGMVLPALHALAFPALLFAVAAARPRRLRSLRPVRRRERRRSRPVL